MEVRSFVMVRFRGESVILWNACGDHAIPITSTLLDIEDPEINELTSILFAFSFGLMRFPCLSNASIRIGF